MLYQSMNHVVLYTVVIVILLIWISIRRNPLMAFVELGKELLHSYKFLLVIVGMISVLLLNKYELQIEQKMQLASDYTSVFFGLEGHFVQTVQQIFYAPGLHLLSLSSISLCSKPCWLLHSESICWRRTA